MDTPVGTYVGIFCIAAYWVATLITLRGVSAIAKATSWAFLAGTVLDGLDFRHVDGGRPRASAVFSQHYRIGRHRLSGRHHSAVRRRRGPRGARQRNGG